MLSPYRDMEETTIQGDHRGRNKGRQKSSKYRKNGKHERVNIGEGTGEGTGEGKSGNKLQRESVRYNLRGRNCTVCRKAVLTANSLVK